MKKLEVKLEEDWVFFYGSKGLFIIDCPVINPPLEIVRQGNTAILNYLKANEKLHFDEN
jgi:hypothetical protein